MTNNFDASYPVVRILRGTVFTMNEQDKKLAGYDSDHIESQEEIIYDHNGGTESVKAGTLAALVEHLTRHDTLDAVFNRTFLTTYKYFISTSALIDLLIARFDSLPSSEVDETRPLIRVRVINILKQWLEHFWTEPKSSEADQNLLRLREFASRATVATETSAVAQLLEIIQRRMAGISHMKVSRLSMSNPPKPILPRKLDKLSFLKIDAKELARQLTIMEAHVFAKIQPKELLNKSWQKKQSFTDPEPAPNIRGLIQYSNQLSNWVGALILAESEMKKRAQIIGHLVNIANVCHELQNYSAVVSILSGFQSAPIYRLTRTWAIVTEKCCNILRPLQALTSSTHNYGAYRRALRTAVPPCIPFLGLYLKDLTFIEDGNQALTPEGLINFHKYTMLAASVDEIQRFKEAPYCLQPVPELQEFLASKLQSATGLDEMWDRSCELEPKGRGETRPRDFYTPTGGMTTSMVVACMVLDD
ncbi:hypothetical protein N7466_005134 [Penicillium verhagenii]|uniref:uncharacterized protein n=1 Tax=Penicillium verhagenii TaxID=1562060 RepID=UPI0025454BD9|nr:uncharacterized protein N7466_005134 [Penicillium verhagenii]KAJ5935587.1 hypothetical protein N7466_005134 [Penicillium verhagenii]